MRFSELGDVVETIESREGRHRESSRTQGELHRELVGEPVRRVESQAGQPEVGAQVPRRQDGMLRRREHRHLAHLGEDVCDDASYCQHVVDVIDQTHVPVAEIAGVGGFRDDHQVGEQRVRQEVLRQRLAGVDQDAPRRDGARRHLDTFGEPVRPLRRVRGVPPVGEHPRDAVVRGAQMVHGAAHGHVHTERHGETVDLGLVGKIHGVHASGRRGDVAHRTAPTRLRPRAGCIHQPARD